MEPELEGQLEEQGYPQWKRREVGSRSSDASFGSDNDGGAFDGTNGTPHDDVNETIVSWKKMMSQMNPRMTNNGRTPPYPKKMPYPKKNVIHVSHHDETP